MRMIGNLFRHGSMVATTIFLTPAADWLPVIKVGREVLEGEKWRWSGLNEESTPLLFLVSVTTNLPVTKMTVTKFDRYTLQQIRRQKSDRYKNDRYTFWCRLQNIRPWPKIDRYKIWPLFFGFGYKTYDRYQRLTVTKFDRYTFGCWLQNIRPL